MALKRKNKGKKNLTGPFFNFSRFLSILVWEKKKNCFRVELLYLIPLSSAFITTYKIRG